MVSIVAARHRKENISESSNHKNGKQESLKAVLEKRKVSSKTNLKRIEEIPEHLRFNKFVLGSYRPPTDWLGCIQSLFYFHNETINILTHAIPIFVIGALIPSFLPYDEISVPYLPTFHIIASMAPWMGSTLYHLFMSHQHGYPVYKTFLTLDILGIWVTQVTGGLITICATIYCLSTEAQQKFLIFYTLLCLYCLYKAMTATCPWSRRFSFTAPFLVRVLMIILRLVGLGSGHPQAITNIVLMDVIAIAGAFIGATNIPERWFPGKLDLVFNSHHLMHVMVVYAVYEMHKAAELDLSWMTNVNANVTECSNHMGMAWQYWKDQLATLL